MTRRIFIDTEWTAAPWSGDAELMWIGLAAEDGPAWYAISADVDIDPEANDFISGAFRLISPDQPRLPTEEIARGVVEFCGDVDEFWAWIPTVERFTEWFDLGERGQELFADFWDWDLQMIRSLVTPWPQGWPEALSNLNTAAAEAGVDLPVRAPNHLNPRVHALWNQELYRRIRASREG